MRKALGIILCMLLLVTGIALAEESEIALPQVGGKVQGWVLDPAGEAIASAQVVLVVGRQKFEAKSDEAGHFLFPSVPAGQGVVMAQKDGYKPEQIKLELGVQEEIKIILEPLPQKPGLLAGQILDAGTGQGIYRVEVIAELISAISQARPPQTWTDAKGYWRLSLPPGQYLVTARQLQYEEYKEQVEVVAGEVTTLSFKLVPKPLPPAFVHGQVQARGQQGLVLMPVADARVVLAMENQSKWETTTDSAGFFQFAAIPPGWGLVLVSKAGYKPWQEKIQLKAGESLALQVYLDSLPVRESLIFGQVKDMKTGKPVAFAKIQALDLDAISLEPRYVTADNQGNYKFFLSPGQYVIETVHPEYIPKQEPVELFPGQNLRLDFLLRPIKQEPSTVVGKVYQGEPRVTLPIVKEQQRNQPIEGAEVSLLGEAGEYKAKTGPDGWFEFPIVEPGRYELLVRKEGYAPYRRTLVVPQGEKVELFIPLISGGPIILD